ncbi:MAG: KpsF/GutQ family sugar-phosphate isomerase, partial [Planctomycetota bacterium]
DVTVSAALRLSSGVHEPENSAKASTFALTRLKMIRDTIRAEATALEEAASLVGPAAVMAAEMSAACSGSVVITGVGKAGQVGQKLVATLASTGTPAHFLHPTEAVHGDFGRVKAEDVVWALSNSGRSEEVTRIAPQLRRQCTSLISFTCDEDNPLAASADCAVVYGKHTEACPLGLAPTSSTTVMMAVGDAVAMLTSQLREFTADQFARFHPGGALGRKLATVDQLMRPLETCRVASDADSVRDCMTAGTSAKRRTGAVMLTDEPGRLVGIFTDSDLVRLLESREEQSLDAPIRDRMTRDPHCISPKTLLSDAISLLSQLRISELPVVDSERRPLGLIDITDLIALGEVSEIPRIIPMIPSDSTE